MVRVGRAGSYAERLAAEARAWGEHLEVEQSGAANAWLDHPLVAEHYRRRGEIDGLSWPEWVRRALGGPAERSLDLGCGSGARSLAVFAAGASRRIEGIDVSAERVAEGDRQREALGIPGELRVGDVNALELAPGSYDLIFSAHSFHHFENLEHVLEQVRRALTPRGLFVLEEYVGPTQFQFTDAQLAAVRLLMESVPERLRRYRDGTLKPFEGRPTPEEVVAVSPFESIRSAEIGPLFEQFFAVLVRRPLGGTLQQLFYNGIVHNFDARDPEALRVMTAVREVEDALIDHGMLASDFELLVGRSPA